MQYGHVPGIIKPISRLVQGTANAAFTPDNPDQAFALLDLAFEHGINTFDSAYVYGEKLETCLGNWIRERGVRDKVVILAKGAHPSEGRNKVTPEDIDLEMGESMKRMGVDYLDLYVLHRDDPAVPVGPIVEALTKHQKAGRIGAFGGSNWTHARLQEANEYASVHGLTPFAVSSPNYSLAEQYEEPWSNCVSIGGPKGEEARAWYAQNDVALFPWSSVAGGFFSDLFHRDNLDTFPPDEYWSGLVLRCYCGETNFQRLDRARDLGMSKGLSPNQIALAFLLNQPVNMFPLVSSTTRGQFVENAAAVEVKLTPSELAYLDLKVPGL